MTGVEIDMVVKDSVRALELYEDVFPVERVEVTAFDRGLNEAVFTLYGTRFHLLDENADYGLTAPREGQSLPIWVNLMVEDIQQTYERALNHEFKSVQDIQRLEEFGVSNAVVKDPFGYHWLLHEMHRVVGFEEREQIWKDKLAKQDLPETRAGHA